MGALRCLGPRATWPGAGRPLAYRPGVAGAGADTAAGPVATDVAVRRLPSFARDTHVLRFYGSKLALQAAVANVEGCVDTDRAFPELLANDMPLQFLNHILSMEIVLRRGGFLADLDVFCMGLPLRSTSGFRFWYKLRFVVALDFFAVPRAASVAKLLWDRNLACAAASAGAVSRGAVAATLVARCPTSSGSPPASTQVLPRAVECIPELSYAVLGPVRWSPIPFSSRKGPVPPAPGGLAECCYTCCVVSWRSASWQSW